MFAGFGGVLFFVFIRGPVGVSRRHQYRGWRAQRVASNRTHTGGRSGGVVRGREVLPVDRALRQRLLRFGDSGIGDLGAGKVGALKVEVVQIGQIFEMHQSRVGDIPTI